MVSPLFCVWCDQFIPVTLFLLTLINTKLNSLAQSQPKRSTVKVVSYGILLFALQTIINLCSYRLRKQSIAGHEKDPVFFSAFLAAATIILWFGLQTFVTFSGSIRKLMKFVSSFEQELETPFSHEAVIRPTNNVFHLERPEIRERLCIAKALTFIVVVINFLFMLKYIIEGYQILICGHVSKEAEFGLSALDDFLLAAIIVFFNILLYASLAFSPDADSRARTKLRFREAYASQMKS